MGTCISKCKKKDKAYSKPQKKGDKKKKEDFEDSRKTEQNGEIKTRNHKKTNLSSSDSDSTSDSDSHDSDTPKAKVSKSRKVKRTKNGGMMIVSSKTIIGGDNITIGEGSKIVNVTLGDRRSRGKSRSNPSGTKDHSQRPPSKRNSGGNAEDLKLPGCFKQLKDKRVLVLDTRCLCDVSQSVGKLCSSSSVATCFRVGSKYIMTAYHAITDICDNEYIPLNVTRRGSFVALENNAVFVDFEYHSSKTSSATSTASSIKFHLTSNVVFKDVALDVAVVELKKGESDFPPPFLSFSNAMPNKAFTLVGHPFGEAKQLNETDGLLQINEQRRLELTSWSRRVAGIDGFAGIEMQNRILFHCSFEKGGSGSPGVVIVDGRAVVVTILLHGYPDWFYNPRYEGIRDQVPNDHRLEQGVNMHSLYDRMYSQDKDLCNAVFGANEEPHGTRSSKAIG